MIAGGGASGTLAAIHLLRSPEPPREVVLVERASVIGRGVACGTPMREHRLNVPTGR